MTRGRPGLRGNASGIERDKSEVKPISARSSRSVSHTSNLSKPVTPDASKSTPSTRRSANCASLPRPFEDELSVLEKTTKDSGGTKSSQASSGVTSPNSSSSEITDPKATPVIPSKASLFGERWAPPVEPKTYTRGGVTWTDRFAGFELGSIAAKTWVESETAFASEHIASLPATAALENALTPRRRAAETPTVIFRDAARELSVRVADGKLPVLDIFPIDPETKKTTGTPRTLDPNTWSLTNEVTLKWYGASPDGSTIVCRLNLDNGDNAALLLVDAATGKTGEMISNVRSVSWTPDSKAFFYVSEPWDDITPGPGQERVMFHRVGDSPDKDVLAFQPPKSLPTSWWTWASEKHRYVESQGELWRRPVDAEPDAPFEPLLQGGRNLEITQRPWSADESFQMVVTDGAGRGRLVSAPSETPLDRSTWTTLVPEHATGKLESVNPIEDLLVVTYVDEGENRLEIRKADGTEFEGGKAAIPVEGLPPFSTLSIYGSEKKDVSVYATSLAAPWEEFKLDLTETVGKATPTAESPPTTPFETKRLWATSADGTKVPYFVAHKKGMKLDGTNPTRLYAYGGFSADEMPSFRAGEPDWMNQGGVFVIAQLRGGAEFGEAWHNAATKTEKQRTFDDFFAVSEALISEGYTNADKLAIEGGSNGGLLVAAAITQRPDLYRAAICDIPLTDMMRFDLSGQGPRWVTEYGSADNAEEAKAIRAYSPVQNVKDDVVYPAMLITPGASDDRVVPWHGHRLAAELAGRDSKGPILLWPEQDASHGGTAFQERWYSRRAGKTAFLMEQLGMEWKAPTQA